jgi:Amt family ammonium transporter
MFAPMATLVVWSLVDMMRTRKTTAIGAATAIVVGLVAITPAAGFVSPISGIVIGGIAAFPSYFGILWRARTRLDDSLDVVAAHGLGGTVGIIGVELVRRYAVPFELVSVLLLVGLIGAVVLARREGE